MSLGEMVAGTANLVPELFEWTEREQFCSVVLSTESGQSNSTFTLALFRKTKGQGSN
jgi:hypothetical protein